MTTDAFLWAIFTLLLVAFVLVIITARRGPWETRYTTSVHTFEESDKGAPMYGSELPEGAYIYRVDSPSQVTLRRRRPRWWRR